MNRDAVLTRTHKLPAFVALRRDRRLKVPPVGVGLVWVVILFVFLNKLGEFCVVWFIMWCRIDAVRTIYLQRKA
jgi:hypothetical protein